MHHEIIRRHNEVVSPDDTVVFTGDVAMGDVELSLELFSLMNGIKVLVPGNHDYVGSAYRVSEAKRARMIALYDTAFDVVLSDRQRNFVHVGGELVLVSHYPFAGESDTEREDRFAELRPVDDGVSLLLHGHVHDQWRLNGRQFNVGVDVNDFTPVSEETVAEWVKETRAGL